MKRSSSIRLCGLLVLSLSRDQLLRLFIDVARPRKSTLYDERFSVAPMMDYTDEHFRSLLRMLTRRAVLYTEMVSSDALVGAQRSHLEDQFDFGGRSLSGGPVILQLGGNGIASLAEAAKNSLPWAYDGINLNCGCPSEKVAGKGCFGAALMRSPDTVAGICSAIRSATGDSIPITVKCRTGVLDTPADLENDVDDEATFQDLCKFVRTVSEDGGVRRFIVHARKAVLSGFEPRENRHVPPLKLDVVLRLCRQLPDLSFVLNGGVSDMAEVSRLLGEHGHVISGVMCGRSVISHPWEFATVDSRVYGDLAGDPSPSRRHVIAQYAEYCAGVEKRLDERLSGERFDKIAERRKELRTRLLKHISNLFAGSEGGRRFKHLALRAGKIFSLQDDAPVARILQNCLEDVPDSVLDAAPGEATAPEMFEW